MWKDSKASPRNEKDSIRLSVCERYAASEQPHAALTQLAARWLPIHSAQG